MHHTGPIAGIAAHKRWVATAGYDNRLILWDAALREPLARATHDHLINACDFSHDGKALVSASSDYSARIWSLPDLRLRAVLAGHEDDVDMARFSPDDRRIATCALDRKVRVFGADGALHHTLCGHTGNVLALVWLDNRRFVTTSVDGSLREWDADTGAALGVVEIGIRTDCVAMAPDGTVYAGDDKGRIVRIEPGQPPQFFAAHRAGIKKLVLSGDGRRLVTLGYDRCLGMWALGDDAPQCLAQSELPAPIWARSAAVLPDGRIAVGTFGGTYALFDPENGRWDLEGVAPGRAINALAEVAGEMLSIGDDGVLRAQGQPRAAMGSLCNFLTAAGGRLFTGGHLGELYDATNAQVLYRHHSPLNCAQGFARGGLPHLAVGTYTGEILVFALAGVPVLVRSLPAHANAIKSLALSEGRLLSASANTDLAWHDTETLEEAQRQPKAHERIANAACALAGGGFATVGRDRMLRIWGQERPEAYLTPHPNSVKALAASPCGRFVASGSYGGTVAVFDRALRAFLPMRWISKAGISALCWSTRAGGFVAADYAGSLRDLPIAQRALRREAA